MNTNQFLRIKKIIFFYLVSIIQLNKKIRFFINYLCIVYGIQIQVFYHYFPNWYTIKIGNIFFYYKSYLIQITDYLFIIKPLITDCKHILIGPIVMSIDLFSFKNFRIYIYKKINFLIKNLSLMFQTFILQIDEDSEEVLTKIKETDLFRKQKPGRKSFFKNTVNEDYSLFHIRVIKQKLYFFIRIIALLIFPYILYQTNRNFHFCSNEPKLTYILEKSNKNQIEFANYFWQNFLTENNVNALSNMRFNLLDSKSNRLIKLRFSNQFRIKKLWDIYINQKQFQINDINYNSYKFLDRINHSSDNLNLSIVRYDLISNVFLKKKLHFLNEKEISLLIYKCASWLIQPKMIDYDVLHNMNNELYINTIDLQFSLPKFINLNHISHLKDKYAVFKKKIEIFFIKNEKLAIQKKILLNTKKLEKIINKMIYHHSFFYKKKNIFLKKYTNTIYSFLHKNLYLINILYDNQCIDLIEKYVIKKIDINRKFILYSLKKDISSISQNSTNVQIQINYFKSLVHNKNVFFYKKNIFDNSQFNLLNQFYKKNQNKISDFPILKILDIIHFNSKYDNIFAKNNIKHDNTINILSLYDHISINPIWIFQKNTNQNLIKQYFFNNKSLKYEIYSIFTKEKVHISNKVNKMVINQINNHLYKFSEYTKNNLKKEIYSINKEYKAKIVQNINSKIILNQYNIQQIYSLNAIDFWKTLKCCSSIKLKFNSFSEFNKKLEIFTSNNVKTKTQDKSIFFPRKYQLQLDLYINNQMKFFDKYFSWVLTTEGCVFIVNLLNKICLIFYNHINSVIELNFIDKINIKDIPENFSQKNIANILQYTTSYFNFVVNKQNDKLIAQSLSYQNYLVYLRSFQFDFFVSISAIISFLAHYWFSFLLGGASFLLWIFFEKIKYLIHTSWNTELNLLVLQNKQKNTNFLFTSLSNKKDLLKEQYDLSLQTWSVWIRFYFSKKIGILSEAIWLENYSPDLYTDQRDLGLKLIIPENLSHNLSLSDLNENIYRKNSDITLTQEGLVYLKKIMNTPFKWYQKQQQLYINKQRMISFSFYKKNNDLLDNCKSDSEFNKTYLPISLELSNLYSKAILLIGPQDTGKSYLVKSIAADKNIPIVYIAIDQLIDVLEFEDNALENDSSLYFLRENIIQYNTISSFIDSMNTCIVWIPNLETIYSSNNFISKTKEQCILLILRLLLKDITQKIATNENLLFFASCENTSYLDPGFISTKRFDRFINLRIPSQLRRPQIFINLLNKKNLNIQIEHEWYAEFSNNTMGFNLRDLSCFANQAFLTSLETNSQYFNIDNIRSVLYREIRINKNDNLNNISKKNIEILLYQIGRSIVQTTLVQPNPMIPLQLKYSVWKPRFYYLSKAYLQPNYLESTVTQLNILPQILSCLAGLAAIDVHYIFGQREFNEHFFNLSIELKHDLDIAINLFESIFKEFSSFEILNLKNPTDTVIPHFRQKYALVNIEQANNILTPKTDINDKEFYVNSLNQLDSFQESNQNILFSVCWSIRTERLNLSRNIIFDLLKKIDEPLSMFSIIRYFHLIPYQQMDFEKEKPYDSIYHRSWDIMKPLVPKDLDYYFYNMLMKQRVSIMGFPILSDQLLEYEPPESDLIFIKNRPIWNPAAISSRHLIFRQRYLFVNEELLSISYLLYQAQQTRFSLYKKTRRQTFWNPDMYLEKIAMNNQKQSNNSFKEIYNFNSFKKIANTNAIFQRPQTEVPHNSEMAFIKRFIASNRFSRFSWTEDIFYQKNQLNENDQKLQELLTYGSILESYYYLIQFFIKNKNLFIEIKNKLLEKNVLFKEDLQSIIYRNL